MERLSLGGAGAGAEGAAMVWDGSAVDGLGRAAMRVSRRGRAVFEGEPSKLRFNRSDLHRVFVESFDRHVGRGVVRCTAPFMVRAEALPGLCGIGRFTQDSLRCSALAASAVEAEVAMLEKLAPKSGRGFAVELEYVFRQPVPSRHLDLAQWEAQMDLLQDCFQGILEAAPQNASAATAGGCRRHSDCALAEYCKRPPSAGVGLCRRRESCRWEGHAAGGGACPIPLTSWIWQQDASINTLSEELEEGLGAARGSESTGMPLEVTAPPPQQALAGIRGARSIVEMLAVLRHMGVQAGPTSSLHVHINVGNHEVPGKMLTPAGVAAVWMAYARFQLVLGEFMTPHRFYSSYARSLFLGRCAPARGLIPHSRLAECSFVRRMFNNIRAEVRKRPTGRSLGFNTREDLLAFCDAAVRMSKDEGKRCSGATAHAQDPRDKRRYWQLNLMSLARHDTLEFRAHAGTYDAERALRWVQLLVAFVEHFGAGRGRSELERFWDGESAEQDYAELQAAQEAATADELFHALEGLIDAETPGYFTERRWEVGDAACAPSPRFVMEDRSRCAPGMDGRFEARLRDSNTYAVAMPQAADRLHFQVILPPHMKIVPAGRRGDVVRYPVLRTALSDPAEGSAFVENGTLLLPRDGIDAFVANFACCCEEGHGGCLWFRNANRCPLVCHRGGSSPPCVVDRRLLKRRPPGMSCRATRHSAGQCPTPADKAHRFAGHSCDLSSFGGSPAQARTLV
mmetsp:Transcript_81922/g.236898  ORF Transcript_81922/g.236898 Transcript_81922/m.236898 type:complete len:739 (+) Transcript_81922:2-2218(+)